MLLALLALALIAFVLATPLALRRVELWRAERALRASRERVGPFDELYDPGRERRAEQRARELLHSCVNEEEWGMYRDLGFIRVAATPTRPEVERAGRGSHAHLAYPPNPI